MRLYLVRHPQTEANASNHYQSAASTLSEAGKQQVELLIKRFNVIPLDAVITSPHERTKTTADAIAQSKGMTALSNELIMEHRWPSALAGLDKGSPEIKKIRKQIEDKWLTDPAWHHSDEDSFVDTRSRAAKFLQYAETELAQNHKNILVVSHARFLKLLISVLLHGSEVSAHTALDLFNKLSLTNAGISVVEFVNNSWHLVTLNDSLHLGDYHRQAQ